MSIKDVGHTEDRPVYYDKTLPQNTLRALWNEFGERETTEAHRGPLYAFRMKQAGIVTLFVGQRCGLDDVYSAGDIGWMRDLAQNIAWDLPFEENEPLKHLASTKDMTLGILFMRSCEKISKPK